MCIPQTNSPKLHNVLLANPKPHEHLVQFYAVDDQLLARNISEYLVEGLGRSESALVVAAPDHREAITSRLHKSRIDIRDVLQNEQLTMLDAQEALDSFMVDRWPDRARFQNTIGTFVRGLRARTGCTGLRVYGEMVGLLWTAGQYSAAIQLEEFWNELLESVEFGLFCGYPIDVFGREFQTDSVYALLCDHTHVLPAGVNDAIDSALKQAMDEVLGPESRDLRLGMKIEHPAAWAAVPASEAKILWLRSNVPDWADDVLARARELYQASATCVNHSGSAAA